MRIMLFKCYHNFYILPALFYTNDGVWYKSIDIAWLNWGISLVLKDE